MAKLSCHLVSLPANRAILVIVSRKVSLLIVFEPVDHFRVRETPLSLHKVRAGEGNLALRMAVLTLITLSDCALTRIRGDGLIVLFGAR